MKTITLLFICTLMSLSTLVKAQITELHFFQSNDVYPFKTSQGIWYAETLYLEDSTVGIYRSDFTHYKDIKVPAMSSTSGLTYLSDKLFNNDSKLEYIFKVPMDETQSIYQLGVFNDEGTLIYNFGDNLYNPSVYITAGEGSNPVLFVYFYDGTDWGTKVYQLPGSYLQVNEVQNEINGLPYPNPADQIIEIPLKPGNQSDLSLKIFNSGGSMIDQKPLSQHDHSIRFETNGLRSGVYFYSGGGVTGKFVVR